MTERYGRYEIKEERGRGSMGVVYKAYDPQIGRFVALKVLRQDRVTSKAFVDRFLREARAIGKLSHPNIVNIYDIGEDKGTVYITMEFIEGVPLSQLMKEGMLSLEQVLEIGAQTAEALSYAHRRGIVHRDVKPSNVILQPDGRVKITDFGIAHIEDPEIPQQTQAGEILGTPAYMSPEQVNGRAVDGRSDLFSLGVVLYEALTGQKPFKGQNIASLFREIVEKTPSPPSSINPEVPDGVSKVVMRCLAKDPAERPSDGEELARELRDHIGQRAEEAPSARRRRPLAIVIGVLVVITLAVGYFLFHPKSQREETRPPAEEVVLKPASLSVATEPSGASLFVDGELKGKTPLKLELRPGKHALRLTLPDHYEWEAQLNVNEGEEIPLNVKLMPIEASR